VSFTLPPHFVALSVALSLELIFYAISKWVFKGFMILSCSKNCHLRQTLLKTSVIRLYISLFHCIILLSFQYRWIQEQATDNTLGQIWYINILTHLSALEQWNKPDPLVTSHLISPHAAGSVSPQSQVYPARYSCLKNEKCTGFFFLNSSLEANWLLVGV